MEPGMYVRLFTSLLVLSEQSTVVHRLCQESSHIIDAPVNNIKPDDKLPPLSNPFSPGIWTNSAGQEVVMLAPNCRHNFAQTDGTVTVGGDPSHEEKYHQLVFERESIVHTIEVMREEKERSLRVLRLREQEALDRIAQEEEKAYEAIDQIVLADQASFDRMRKELEQGWVALEEDRVALRDAQERADFAHDSGLAELQDIGHRVSRHHIKVCREKKRVAEKRLQLDLLTRQLVLQVGKR
jgi:hypothetical protein